MVTICSSVAIAFLLALLFTPQVREQARRFGILDVPDSERKLHAKETPLCGGVAVFLATLATVCVVLVARSQVGLMVAGAVTNLLPLLLAAVVILAVGVLDDVLELRGRQKLAGQLLAVGILVLSGLRIDNFEVAGFELTLGLLALPVTAIWLLGAINALNLLDGADGFASTIGLVISASVAAIAVQRGQWVEAVVAVSMTGALLGFLVFNLPPSSIFLGDSGSMLIGLVLGTLAIYGHNKATTTLAMSAPLALMALPFFDSLAAIIRRTLTGRGIAIGDRAHLHHAFMRRGLGPRRLVISAAMLTFIPAAGAYLNVVTGNQWYAFGSIGLLVSILVGTRSFGFSELQLVTNRALAFGDSLIPKPTSPSQGRPARQRKVGLIDSHHCQELWTTLTRFADEHGLSRLRLDLQGSWMDDGHDVLWEQIHPQAKVENWRTSVPVFARDRLFGKVEIAGTVHGTSGQHIMVPLADLLHSLEPYVDRLIEDSASQGTVMQEGVARRVLFINRSYWPDCEATGQLLTELCEDLGEKFAVSVLAGQPNHVTEQQDSYRAAGVQRRNGVDIYRVRHSRFKKGSMLGKACNMISFMLAATWQSFFIPKHQVVVVETDPFLLALLGGLLKRWRGSSLVIYVQDVYPDVAVAIGKVKNGWITRQVRAMLMRAYERADRIVVLGRDMQRRLERHGVPGDKIRCIPNWIDTKNVYPIKTQNDFRREHKLTDKFVVMHSGNMGLTQQLDELVAVAQRLNHRQDIVFLMVGEGASRSRLEQIVRRQQITTVRFLPYQSREKLALSLSAADLHVVSMHPSISGCVVPSKIYGIMASGTPVLAIVPDDTDVHQLVEEEQIGVALMPGDQDGIEASIVRCADGQLDMAGMGDRARRLAEQRFDRSHSVVAFSNLLHDFIHPKREPGRVIPASHRGPVRAAKAASGAESIPTA